MNRLFLFNPENDIALGSGLARITPPKMARLLHLGGEALPVWLAQKGDYILAPDIIDKEFETAEQLGVTLVRSAKGLDISELCPWGWSLDACNQFEKAGVDEKLVDLHRNRMDAHRELSHRRSSLILKKILHLDAYELHDTEAVEAKNIDDAKTFISSVGAAFVKAPWSCSGRGVFRVDINTFPENSARILGCIKQQGSVIIEKALDKVIEFAMLFNYNPALAASKVCFVGYSMTKTAENGRYLGNVVAPQNEIKDTLVSFVSRESLIAIRRAVCSALPLLLGDTYSGPLGIDMMIYRDSAGAIKVNPCIEINLRYTMGFVARNLWERRGIKGALAFVPTNTGLSHEGYDIVPENDYFRIVLLKA